MADLYTNTWGSSSSPRLKLVWSWTSYATSVTYSWTLYYVASYAARTNGYSRAWSVNIGGDITYGSYNINGVTGTINLGSGSKTINRTHASQSITIKIIMDIDVTWSGTYASSVSGSTTDTIDAKSSYTVSYNANGGSGAPSSQTKWYGETLTLQSTKPTRTGYSFKNWNTNSGGTETSYASGASYTANSGVTLYAQWTANTYAVKYDANGGTGAPSQQTKTYGVDLTLSSTTPTRTNYNFLGWGTSASATTVSYAAGATYSANADITLYAVWELAYWRPKITNLSVARCASDGTADEYGTYALVKFDWELCQLLGTNDVSSITIVCNSDTTTVSASGISGSVSQVIGADALSTDSTYDVVVTVTDSMDGSTSFTKTIATSAFAIDILAGGKGVAFGKTAETENLIDSAWCMNVTRNSSGEANFVAKRTDTETEVFMGVGTGGTNHGLYSRTLDKWMIYADDSKTYVKNVELTENIPVLGSGNCNSLTTTGKYYIGSSGTNKPVAHNGWLESKKYSTDYCHQIYTTYQGHTYTRLMSAGTWGSWKYIYGVDGSKSTNKVLWSGEFHMDSYQTITLSEAVSKQEHGIVLVWSGFFDGITENWNFTHFFVPKHFTANFSGKGVFMGMPFFDGWSISKYVYVADTSITGNAYNSLGILTDNEDSGRLKIRNDGNVLRYVLGV